MQKKVKNKRKQAKRQDRYKWGLAEQATLVLKLAGFKANQYRSAQQTWSERGREEVEE